MVIGLYNISYHPKTPSFVSTLPLLRSFVTEEGVLTPPTVKPRGLPNNSHVKPHSICHHLALTVLNHSKSALVTKRIL